MTSDDVIKQFSYIMTEKIKRDVIDKKNLIKA